METPYPLLQMNISLFAEVVNAFIKLKVFSIDDLVDIHDNFDERLKVGNLRRGNVLPSGYKPVYFGRPTIYQNPIRLIHEKERRMVLVKYDSYLVDRIENDRQFNRAICELLEECVINKQLVLTCWCYPKDCHASTFLTRLRCMLAEIVVKDIK